MENPFKGLDKKDITKWALVGGVGLVILVMSSLFTPAPGGGSGTRSRTSSTPPASPTSLTQAEQGLETGLVSVLEQVRGAGVVRVSVTLTNGPTQEMATAGNGGMGSSVIGLQGAKVAGVLVVASGAGDPRVQEELAQGVATDLGIPAYHVDVLPGK